MLTDHFVLIGGGHTHALALLYWIKNPSRKPQGLITLVSIESTTLYSGMIPGVISGEYQINEAEINIRVLADLAKIEFVKAKVIGIDLLEKFLKVENRPRISFDYLSIDVGSETNYSGFEEKELKRKNVFPIKPLYKSIEFIKSQDSYKINNEPFTVIGSGLSAIEIIFALRKRWPNKKLYLKTFENRILSKFRSTLLEVDVNIISPNKRIDSPTLICTGSRAPCWLEKSGLPVDRLGRVLTKDTLQVICFSYIFAVGDCGVIDQRFRPPSGVWAVKASLPLLTNLENVSKRKTLRPWYSQKRALQLLGAEINGNSLAWAIWGSWIIGPNPLLKLWKKNIDKNFIDKFRMLYMTKENLEKFEMDMSCRGCAAKVAAKPLQEALQTLEGNHSIFSPEDSALIQLPEAAGEFVQSVDGFPAIVSDPWLNGKLTAIHACTDIWACGASVLSAQVVATLPAISEKLQKELLVQSLGGIKSVLDSQGAKLLGGHTVESRSNSLNPSSLDIQLSITLNGSLGKSQRFWSKSGLQSGDVLLLSGAIGSGVIFSASMRGKCKAKDLDHVIEYLAKGQSQQFLILKELEKEYIKSSIVNACTDVTGFGLLGHLGEMINSTNYKRSLKDLPNIRVVLKASSIPFYPSVLDLIQSGHLSTLAPANRRAWKLLELDNLDPPCVEIDLGDFSLNSRYHKTILELIIDPQTCGPLLISCCKNIGSRLIKTGLWHQIGHVL